MPCSQECSEVEFDLGSLGVGLGHGNPLLLRVEEKFDRNVVPLLTRDTRYLDAGGVRLLFTDATWVNVRGRAARSLCATATVNRHSHRCVAFALLLWIEQERNTRCRRC